MNKRLPALFLTFVALVLAACATTSTPPFIEEHVPASKAQSDTLFIQATAILTYNDSDFDPLVGIRLMPGRFTLEAENENYWFFRAPKPVDLLMYDFGRIINGTNVRGGVMLAKDATNPKSAAVYIDGNSDEEKIVIRYLNKQFTSDRGKKWTLSTDNTAP